MRNAYHFVLEPKPPYMFTKHLELFSIPGEPTPYFYDRERRECRVLVGLDRQIYVPTRCIFTGEPYNPLIECMVYTRRRYIERVKKTISDRFRINFDYKDFLEAVENNPKLKKLAVRNPGLRPGRYSSLYEALVDVVVKQRISLKLALKITSRLVKRYGYRMVAGGLEYYSHPLPENLAEASIDEIRRYGLTRVKARALRGIAEAELEGRLPSVREAVNDPWRVSAELTNLYGVGEWTAELAVAMVLPDFRIGPRTDLSVRRGLKRLGIDLDRYTGVDRYIGLIMYLASIHHSI